MALMKCTECGKEVSDKAVSCPNCGCPINLENDSILTELKKQATESKKEKTKTKLTVFIWLAVICSIICVSLFLWSLANEAKIASAHLSEFSATYGYGYISSSEKALLKTESIVIIIRNVLAVPSLIFIILSIYYGKKVDRK